MRPQLLGRSGWSGSPAVLGAHCLGAASQRAFVPGVRGYAGSWVGGGLRSESLLWAGDLIRPLSVCLPARRGVCPAASSPGPRLPTPGLPEGRGLVYREPHPSCWAGAPENQASCCGKQTASTSGGFHRENPAPGSSPARCHRCCAEFTGRAVRPGRELTGLHEGPETEGKTDQKPKEPEPVWLRG